jgi:hypothetical protein
MRGMEKSSNRYTGEVVRIALIASDKGTIRDTEFVDCDIHGPAVIFAGGEGHIESCQWDGDFDSIIWPISPERQRLSGAVVLERCSFVGCRFRNVGIAAQEAAIPEIKAGFGMENG